MPGSRDVIDPKKLARPELSTPVIPPETFVNPETITQAPESKPTPQETTPVVENRELPKETGARIEIEPIESTISSLKKKLRLTKKKKMVIPTVKDEITIRIERVMEEDIVDAFKEMTPVQQQEFKIKGEETAWQIRQILKKTKFKLKEIFKLLFEWLRLLPGVNKFFIEQEAKIKADKIFSLRKHHQSE